MRGLASQPMKSINTQVYNPAESPSWLGLTRPTSRVAGDCLPVRAVTKGPRVRQPSGRADGLSSRCSEITASGRSTVHLAETKFSECALSSRTKRALVEHDSQKQERILPVGLSRVYDYPGELTSPLWLSQHGVPRIGLAQCDDGRLDSVDLGIDWSTDLVAQRYPRQPKEPESTQIDPES